MALILQLSQQTLLIIINFKGNFHFVQGYKGHYVNEGHTHDHTGMNRCIHKYTHYNTIQKWE